VRHARDASELIHNNVVYHGLVFPERHALLQYFCFPPMALAEVVTGFYLMLFAFGKESKTPAVPASSAVNA
jgi:hypothetical protein